LTAGYSPGGTRDECDALSAPPRRCRRRGCGHLSLREVATHEGEAVRSFPLPRLPSQVALSVATGGPQREVLPLRASPDFSTDFPIDRLSRISSPPARERRRSSAKSASKHAGAPPPTRARIRVRMPHVPADRPSHSVRK
jgi:hypothetical protein